MKGLTTISLSALLLMAGACSSGGNDVEARRQEFAEQNRATEQQLLDEIADTDSLLAVLQLRGDERFQSLNRVDNPVEPYYLLGTTDHDLQGRSTLQARLTPEGLLYITAVATPAANFQAISIKAADGSSAQTAAVAPDNEQSYAVEGTRYVTFSGDDAMAIGKFCLDHRGEACTVELVGAGRSIKLSPEVVTQIADSYDYADTRRQITLASLEKEKKERQLAAVRGAIARSTPESSDDQSTPTEK